MLQQPPEGFEHFLPDMERAFLKNYPSVLRQRLEKVESAVASGTLKKTVTGTYGFQTDYQRATNIKKELDLKYAELVKKNASSNLPATAKEAQEQHEAAASMARAAAATSSSAPPSTSEAGATRSGAHNAGAVTESSSSSSSSSAAGGDAQQQQQQLPAASGKENEAQPMELSSDSEYEYEEEPDYDAFSEDGGEL